MDQYNDWSSDAGYKTDESYNASPAPRSGLRPAWKAPVRLTQASWTSDEDEDELPIPYNVEWKLSINRRRRAGELETGIEMSPR